LFPFASILVPESEKSLYEYLDNKIETVPDSIVGLGQLRNWILDNYDEEAIIMIDDDITECRCICRESYYKVTDVEEIKAVLLNALNCAKDLGTSVFGFDQSADVRKYTASQPFSLCAWVGGVIGVIGRKHRFLADHKFKVDIDFCLEVLKHDRIVFKDNRFAFLQNRNFMKGGNSKYRTKEDVEQEIYRLKNKWGSHFKFKQTKSGEETQVRVQRRNPLMLMKHF
jgi:glycosyltransferase involved in cell wall biosynthesis